MIPGFMKGEKKHYILWNGIIDHFLAMGLQLFPQPYKCFGSLLLPIPLSLIPVSCQHSEQHWEKKLKIAVEYMVWCYFQEKPRSYNSLLRNRWKLYGFIENFWWCCFWGFPRSDVTLSPTTLHLCPPLTGCQVGPGNPTCLPSLTELPGPVILAVVLIKVT